ncbi:GGDEF domain-containing protein [Bacillus salitolerans]|uniref:GGDEF domain-containing protein n=1 Tax=Bacillus salitolerans TaxID=1437434 RepID=A0ABW4LND8_9BACI
MLTYIGEIAENVPSVFTHSIGADAHALFEENPHIEGIVVINLERNPVGLIMKSMFYKKLALRYGLDLFMGRSVELIMDKKPLIVDYYSPITDTSNNAMKREQEHLYDYVIVKKENLFFGIVSIKTLLVKFAEIQVEIAKYTNPLSGLPGNKIIEENLLKILYQKEFSVLYLDLDHFKTFNDTYGFNKGDILLRETATLISKTVLSKADTGTFIGHIGGDDFIVILHSYEFQIICEAIINQFNVMIKDMYTDEIYKRGFVLAKNRLGVTENIPLVAISIAVVTNKETQFATIDELSRVAAEIKKICKQNESSCYCSNVCTLKN